MKTSRRQELKTNELSQQIDQVGDYVRQNMTTFTAVILGAALIVAGIFWYINRERTQLMDAWATLGHEPSATEAASAIDQYRGVAERNLDPALTVHAWLRVGNAAVMEMAKGKGVVPSNRDWGKVAEEAFTKVFELNPKDAVPLGEALIGLGVMAENRGDIEAARSKYKQVAEDSRFSGLPVKDQAGYRLAGLDKWSTPIVFPPPPPTSAPSSMPAALPMNFSITPTPVAPAPASQPGK